MCLCENFRGGLFYVCGSLDNFYIIVPPLIHMYVLEKRAQIMVFLTRGIQAQLSTTIIGRQIRRNVFKHAQYHSFNFALKN